MTRSLSTASTLLAGLVLLGVGSACKKPDPFQPAPPVPANQGPSQTALDAKAAADRVAAEEAKRQAELEADRRDEAARRIEIDKQLALRRSTVEALQDIHFDYDKSEIRAEDKRHLQKVSELLKAHPSAKVEIQGYCDERGTNEYNLALGNRRASVTMRYLMSLGVQEQRFSLISYGKEKPVCTESNETCWSRNRRVHFELR
jgi:peptidoglycan-associated lipoprotein